VSPIALTTTTTSVPESIDSRILRATIEKLRQRIPEEDL